MQKIIATIVNDFESAPRGSGLEDHLVLVCGADDAAEIQDSIEELNRRHSDVTQSGDRARWLADKLSDLDAQADGTLLRRLLPGTDAPTPGQVALALLDQGRGTLAGTADVVEKVVVGSVSSVSGKRSSSFFERPLGSAEDGEDVAVVSAAVLAAVREQVGSETAAYLVVAGIDLGMGMVKVAYQIAIGLISAGDGLTWVADRLAAGVAFVVERTVAAGVEKLGGTIGAAIGTYFGVASMGASIGANIGRMAGEAIASHIGLGVKQLVSAGLHAAGRLASSIGSAVSSKIRSLLN